MKVSRTILCGFIFAFSSSIPGVSGVVAPDTPEESDICAKTPIDNDEPLTCIDNGLVCNQDEDGCCEGLKCTGFGFFKKCEEPHVCLPKWYDCSDGTACCDGMVCALGKQGQLECQENQIGTRTVTIDVDGNWVATEPPTPTPPENLEETPKTNPVVRNVAASTGDPHIRTFDGLPYDCQGEGEHILMKSTTTQREVQARYEHMGVNKAISIGKGVAVQDEGDTPRVQISIASASETVGNEMSDGGVLLFYVNGEQKDLTEGSGDDRVEVTMDNSNLIRIFYPKTEFEVDVKYRKLRFDIVVKLPNTDKTIGILGTANGDVTDDWTTPEGDLFPMPESRAGKMRKPGYDFCTTHYCIREESKSLFVHREAGFDFAYYEQCDLPYGETLEKALTNTPGWVRELCGNDPPCIMDVMNGDAEDARHLRNAKLMTAGFCRPSGGDCDDDDDCCGDAKCNDMGGLAGKQCDGDMTCAPEFGSCDRLACCGEHTCTELNDGSHQCLDQRVCQDEWMSCDDNGKECCEGTVCLNNWNKGTKECRKLPSCMKNLDDCTQVGCCGSLKCMDLPNGGKQCQDVPGCWKNQNKDCSQTPCCDGLTCVDVSSTQKLCKKLPQCMRLGQSCEWVGCCENAENPMECVAVTDANGQEGKQCRYVPGEVEVKVFNDLNGDGIQDDNEPGVEGVGLQLYDDEMKVMLPHAEVLSDGDGMVKFLNVPKVKRTRVKVTSPPKGAVRTQQNRGGNDEKDSDLRHDHFSDSFRVSGGSWTKTALGYLLPEEVKVKVFNDLNGNGIQEEGETGIKGVSMILETKEKQDKEWIYFGLADQENGGNSHTEVTTDEDGIATFTGVPQNLRMNVAITDPPDGAIPTKANQGKDDSVDSDLYNNGKSVEFYIKGGSCTTDLTLGYRMPSSVNVRVWDDTNSNGKQDIGEVGIAGVPLRLVLDDGEKTEFVQEGVEGTADKVVETDADGVATFTSVPQNKRFRVKVVTPPLNAIPTYANKGGVDKESNSDLQGGNLSDSFTLTTSGASFSEIDLGYRMPNTMIVRVWDDANGDGEQGENEVGIADVQLQLLKQDKKTPLEDKEDGGTAGKKIRTNAQGFASFTMVPQGEYLYVQVVDAPDGAAATMKDRGGDKTKDSDLNSNLLSDGFRMNTADDFTEIDLGFTMPSQMVVRVWDDQNNNGLQDEGEDGIKDVGLKLVLDKGRAEIEGFGEIFTDETGVATFEGVPSGQYLRVKVTNMPKGAIRARQNAEGNKMEDKDSDLGSNNESHSFNLAKFEGSTFSSLDFGFLLPKGVEVRVWDDVNGNGYQDEGEAGIENVQLQLLEDNTKEPVVDQENGGNAHEILTTDADGVVTFTEVPKGRYFRIKMLNKPEGAIVTQKNAGGNKDGADEKDSDLDGGKMWSDSFNLVSFHGNGATGRMDLGLRLPSSMDVRVWEDVNGNGLQDEGEPGISGVELAIVNDDKERTAVTTNYGAGSTVHTTQITNEDGLATFIGVPRGNNYRVKVMKAPPGSKCTTKNAGSNKNEDSDSDLNTDMTTDRFNLHYFKDDGNYGQMDLGFKMPKTVVVRAWNDVNKDGLQDENEESLAGVTAHLVLDKRDNDGNYLPMPDQENDGTAHQTFTTDATGLITFTKVPQGFKFRVAVDPIPEGFKVTRKNASSNKEDEHDSELNGNGLTDAFNLPSTCEELFDTIDIGFYAV